MKIYMHAKLDAAAEAVIREGLSSREILFRMDCGGEASERKALADADVAFGNVPADWLEESKSLKWLQLESTGFESYQGLSPERRQGLVISNLKDMFAAPAAETAIGGLLTLFRRLDALTALKDAGTWQQSDLRTGMRVLRGKSVLILGSGSIGRHCRKLLAAFGCQVALYGRKKPKADLAGEAELDEALGGTDIVLACLPNTLQTRGLIDRRRLGLMGAKSVFANIGRGSLVDEVALAEALDTGRLAGAVIDVTQEEPLPEGHPLWNCPKTILTQHTAGGYDEELLDKAKCFVENFRRFQKAEEPLNVVDLDKGY